jgi:hypothetical protein
MVLAIILLALLHSIPAEARHSQIRSVTILKWAPELRQMPANVRKRSHHCYNPSSWCCQRDVRYGTLRGADCEWEGKRLGTLPCTILGLRVAGAALGHCCCRSRVPELMTCKLFQGTWLVSRTEDWLPQQLSCCPRIWILKCMMGSLCRER